MTFCPSLCLFFFFLCLSATDEEVASLNMIKSAPVGPVAGGIMGCIMVLVLAVYAYRHQIHRRSHQHMSPLAAQGRTDGWMLILLIDHLIKSILTITHHHHVQNEPKSIVFCICGGLCSFLPTGWPQVNYRSNSVKASCLY